MSNTEQPIYYVSCPKKLDDLVREELLENKLIVDKTLMSGVIFHGEKADVARFILNSRFSSRVYLQITSFNFKDPDNFHYKLRNVSWMGYLLPKEEFKVNTVVIGGGHKSIKNSHFMSLKLKDAICDWFKEKKKLRPNINTEAPDKLFYSFIEIKNEYKARAEIYVDLSGLLSHRGYRIKSFTAPLRENLAAAIIKRMDWNPEEENFYDLMCGSGTATIEACLLKGNIPPSYLKKDFPFDKIPAWHQNEMTDQLYDIKCDIQKQADEGLKRLRDSSSTFYCSDISSDSTRISRAHFRKAGVVDFIEITQEDVVNYRRTDENSVVFVNPPYGKRLEEDMQELEDLYADIGETFKANFKNSKCYIFTANMELRKKISLQTSKRIEFHNGQLEARLFEYKIF